MHCVNVCFLFGESLRQYIVSYFLGLAQCAELCWQLRGVAGRRQVPNAKLALQHNIGLGGAVVVALYKLGFPGASEGRYATLQVFYIFHCNMQTISVFSRISVYMTLNNMGRSKL